MLSKILRVLGIAFVIIYALIMTGGEDYQIIDNSYNFFEAADSSLALYKPVVRITFKHGQCSGWVVSRHYLITAAHCLNEDGYQELGKYRLYSSSGIDTEVDATVGGYDADSDLGYLVGDFSKFHILKTDLISEQFMEKHSYIAFGFPQGQKEISYSHFVLKEMDGFKVKGFGHFVQGMSGGPIVNENGVAVALINAVDGNVVIISPLMGFMGLFGLD